MILGDVMFALQVLDLRPRRSARLAEALRCGHSADKDGTFARAPSALPHSSDDSSADIIQRIVNVCSFPGSRASASLRKMCSGCASRAAQPKYQAHASPEKKCIADARWKRLLRSAAALRTRNQRCHRQHVHVEALLH